MKLLIFRVCCIWLLTVQFCFVLSLADEIQAAGHRDVGWFRVDAVIMNQTSIQLSWDGVADSEYYRIYYDDVTAAERDQLSVTVNTQHVLLQNLCRGCQYRIRLAGFDVHGLIVESAPMVCRLASDETGSSNCSSVELEQFPDQLVRSIKAEVQYLNIRRHRAKRDADTVINGVVASLEVFGIIVSFGSPALGGILGVTSTILGFVLPLIYSDGGSGDPKHAMQEIIWNERARDQKAKMIDFRGLLADIELHINTTRDPESRRRLMNLMDAMSRSSCSVFMHSTNIKSDGSFFNEFATLHIIVSQMVLMNYPNDTHWNASLHRTVDKYIRHARYLMYKSADEDGVSIVDVLQPSIDKWIQQLAPAARPSYDAALRYLRYDGWVSFKVPSSQRNEWLSCWNNQGQYGCHLSQCPGRDNSMVHGSQFPDWWKCRGEVFKLVNVYPSADGVVRSCDNVGLYYKETCSSHRWVDIYDGYIWLFGWIRVKPHLKTSVCAGSSAYVMREGGSCAHHAMKIQAEKKTCGSPITEYDIVSFWSREGDRNAHVAVESHSYIRRFVVYRSDVPYVNMTDSMPCPP